jgi:hypothetical protein
MTKAYFQNIETVVIEKITTAKSDISIAVAWINNTKIFDILIEKANKMSVALIISNDINNYNNGINFQEFIDAGGVLYLHANKKLMHNKYAILDNKTIITGSYNFTFGAEFLNYENLIVINDNSQLVSSYNENFNFLVNSAKNVTNFDYDINKVEDISISILQNEIATSESIFDSTRKEDYDYVTNSLVELYNLGRIETTARSILTLIEDKLPHVTNQRLLKISYLILRETGDDALAQICLDRIDNSSKIEEAAPLLIKYKLKILL